MVECYVRYSLGNALADDFERIGSAGDYVSSKEDSAFEDSEGSLDGAFDEAFRWLIDYFLDSFCYVIEENVEAA